MKRTVMVVFGTRPEAIKLAPVVHALARSRSLRPCVCVTGQHREMLDQMLSVFDLRPDHDLAVMQSDQTLFTLTARLLGALEPVLARERPAAILVQGDTTTAFAAALAGYYVRVPTGHVEAGLRTDDRYNPFPEEMNRRLTTDLASWHFAPTPRAAANLAREGVPADGIVLTGNTIVDALHEMLARLERQGELPESLLPPELAAGRRLIVVTGHRRESFGEGLRNICAALRTIAERNDDVVVLYPVHLNPNVQRPVRALLHDHPRVILTEPLDYLPFIDLLRRAYLILTDSGGIQEEAPSLGVPVLVMRTTTERPEGVEAGVARLVGTGSAAIGEAAQLLLDDPAAHRRMVAAANPYGDGHAAEKIVHHLERMLARTGA
ncbi:UDP-N-acetylglucosamine 2-epimerase (non-hydrolyzing) [Candidatus Binatia bacterium]|nr:UDP-N-acetylglucosamine 2-epimerase (non-hydrolyzing) [Candidatus Binatia bacterium]